MKSSKGVGMSTLFMAIERERDQLNLLEKKTRDLPIIRNATININRDTIHIHPFNKVSPSLPVP